MVMPISYDKAYGGTDNTHEKPEKHKAYMLNPIGVGFHSNLKKEFIHGNRFRIRKNRINPSRNRQASIARWLWRDRAGLGASPQVCGNYDQNWIDNVFPFLPSDFKDEYFQAAPLDQQIDYLRGGEEVVLKNLTPHGYTRFQIPQVQLPVVFF
jgi:hypothetical protein